MMTACRMGVFLRVCSMPFGAGVGVRMQAEATLADSLCIV